MQADESATVDTLDAYRVAMRGIIEQHKGRVVNAPGDALLAEFASVVEAVAVAVRSGVILFTGDFLSLDRRFKI